MRTKKRNKVTACCAPKGSITGYYTAVSITISLYLAAGGYAVLIKPDGIAAWSLPFPYGRKFYVFEISIYRRTGDFL